MIGQLAAVVFPEQTSRRPPTPTTQPQGRRGNGMDSFRAGSTLPLPQNSTIIQLIVHVPPLPNGSTTLRFLEDGPSIPDELLHARDQGRVVFFCGAGVSQAKAGLPSFLGLARKVVEALGVQSSSPAIALLDQAQTVGERTSDTGQIPADRIFGILERDFLVPDVHKAVANALRPHNPPALSAHETILDLATAPDGEVRIVTTNFDRLFDDCDPDLRTYRRPYLPDPSRPGNMNGVVYLHGKATENYDGAEGDGFVLSSSAFGRAYLAEGWATSFFRQIILEYVVVFVGYAADDPPVQYLLEALNTRSDTPQGVYAFQSGAADHAASKWLHKGVEAIPYGDHPALWSTLNAWAVRARDPNKWYSAIIDGAKRNPEELSPSERGQVAHVVSTTEGLRKFSASEDPPPAEWLCVFDPRIRYGSPGPSGTWRQPGPVVDPFDCYCIDSDVTPDRAQPEQNPAPRDVPSDAWNALSCSRIDKSDSIDTSFLQFRGRGSRMPQPLSRRLASMVRWLGKVAAQPTAIWWAARQSALHPEISDHIWWAIRHSQRSASPDVRSAWLYLFEYWERTSLDDSEQCHEVIAQISADGWSATAIRRYGTAFRPYLKAGPSWWWRGEIPPKWPRETALQSLVHLEVVYPTTIDEDVEVPDGSLGSIVVELRRNLTVALTLEKEIGGFGLGHVAPISTTGNPNETVISHADGLSGLLHGFARGFERLCTLDLQAARREFSNWPADDDTMFARLRIWAARKPDLVPNDTFRAFLSELSDSSFWDRGHQRDLLLTLAARWNTSDRESRLHIERRLLTGRPRREHEAEAEFLRRRAQRTLDRVTWLSRQGCELVLDLDEETSRLREFAVDWKPGHAESAAESLEGQGGVVTTRTELAVLLSEPLASTLSKAQELSGRREHFLVEDDPYRGLSAERPVRALSVLSIVARRAEYPHWAWTTFLTTGARKTDRPRFMALIAERLVRCPPRAVSRFLHAATRWLRDVGEVLAREYPNSFRVAIRFLIRVLERYPEVAGSGVRGRGRRNWATETVNSPMGMVVEDLFFDTEVRDLRAGDGLPTALTDHLKRLLAFGGDLRRYVIVVLTSRLQWFHAVDREWSEQNLLSALGPDDRDGEAAFWSGFFLASTIPGPTLYLRVKEHLLNLATDRNQERGKHNEMLAGLILAGWGSVNDTEGEPYISNEELRDILVQTDDRFRTAVLWHAERWMESTERDGENGRWRLLVPKLLREVWPRQISVKTPATSARLFALVFASEAQLPALAEIVEQLLSELGDDRVALPRFREASRMIDKYPREVLGLLYAVLPQRAGAWPFGTEEMLERIWEADETLRLDRRLRELRRRWDTR